jgi:FkbM family methyltransferase
VLPRSDVIIEALSGDRFLVPQLSESVAFHLFVDGIYEPATDAYLRTVLEARDVFVDVGANIGVFALRAARRVGNTGRVLAIEASPNVFRYLVKNIELSGLANVKAIHCAASDHHSEGLSFWEAPRSNFGMGALVPQFEAAPHFVPCRTLDELLGLAGIKHVSLLKVDVEGAEADVFRGALRFLRSSPAPIIIFEFCDWAEARFPGRRPGDSQRVLMHLGYEIWRLEDLQLGGRSLSEPLVEGFEMLVAMRKESKNQCVGQLKPEL